MTEAEALRFLLDNSCYNPSDRAVDGRQVYIDLCCQSVEMHVVRHDDGSYAIHGLELF